MYQGYLRAVLTTAYGALPSENQAVYIKVRPMNENDNAGYSPVSPENFTYRLTTDSSGTTGTVSVMTPSIALSENEFAEGVPYSLADIYADVPGYFPVRVEGVQVFPNNLSVIPINLTPVTAEYTGTQNGVIVYTIPESPLRLNEERNIIGFSETAASPQILTEVVIPEYITVHLGRPSSNAENVQVPFPEYIKNVASSEIYPTWTEETLKANILAIISLTLNRIYSEWYPSQGYSFDITNSTQFDQSYVPGRNIFDNISKLTDELFTTYITRTGFENPLFATYCDGRTTTCNGLLQWGSENLGMQGYTALEILKYYYGNNIETVTTDNVGVTDDSYPGYPLSLGSEGPEVETLRRQLYRISFNYPLIPRVNPILRTFDSSVDSAVRTFQSIFDLDVDGIVGRATWYKISYVYSSIIRLAELTASGEAASIPATAPDIQLIRGDSGRFVALAQFMLSYISLFYDGISSAGLDGIFGAVTESAVRNFQSAFGLPVTGIITSEDWEKIFEVYNEVLETVTPSLGEQAYPGEPLRRGSSGEAVRLMQEYLNRIAVNYPVIPTIEADGVFGPATEQAVEAFQRRFFLEPTGVIDAITWGLIAGTYNFVVNES